VSLADVSKDGTASIFRVRVSKSGMLGCNATGNTIVRNVGNFSSNDTASHPGTPKDVMLFHLSQFSVKRSGYDRSTLDPWKQRVT
jgi:hypothetical protein